MSFSAETIDRICTALADGRTREAAEIAQKELPFDPPMRDKRKYSLAEATKIFVRDGFIDRYSGERLVFPGALRVLSQVLPTEIPYQPNWKTSECHLLYWYLSPTVDHVVPIARGGQDVESNWVCTSMLRNAVKSHWTLEDLNWELLPPGRYEDWDGKLGWYIDYVEAHRNLLDDSFHRRWYKAARGVT